MDPNDYLERPQAYVPLVPRTLRAPTVRLARLSVPRRRLRPSRGATCSGSRARRKLYTLAVNKTVARSEP